MFYRYSCYNNLNKGIIMVEKFFKYLKFDIAIKVLKNKKIRFSSSKLFNDPYDINPPYKYSYPYYTDTEKNNLDIILKKFSDDALILSLSKTNKNLLMWGHYADCHKGIVIEFNPKAKILDGCTDVKYKKDIVDLEYSYNKYFSKDCIALTNTLKKLFTTKSICWKYEKEKRIIVDKPTLIKYLKQRSKNRNFDKLEEQNYIDVDFNPTDIKAIYLGANISNENKKYLISLIKERYKHIKILYQAELSQKAYRILFDKIEV